MCELVAIEEIENLFNSPYFSLIKKLQLSVGLWPYTSTWWKYFVKILLYSILFVAYIPLFNGVRVWCGIDMDICVENFIGILYTSAIFVKYFLMTLAEKKLKMIYEIVVKNWLVITDPTERAILLKHAKVGRAYSLGIFVYLGICALFFSQVPDVPYILDFLFPLNESRPKILFVKAEYIIDPYEHFGKIYLYFQVASVITMLSFASIDGTYFSIVHQTLGLMSIVKRRLRLATEFAVGQRDNSYDIIITAITLHQESIIFVNLIEESYSIVFFIIFVGSAFFVSAGVILILNNGNLIEIIRFIPMEIGVVIHIFYLSFMAQQIIDYSSDLFTAIYMTEWYRISAKSKKLLKFMMLRTSKPCVITAGGFYVMNMYNFGMIIKTAISYTTVLSSLR